ncbi:MAG: Asp-tRNA(Asn)/Glu-tRNA(Gln) amidotransferase subunit GatA [Chloroflexi bacterium]|nr:Asp-tRNA(Asn)/Glu-tRNA(Gln) amidotransferase subunit GatA [Chloroflexota bacterium]
MPDNLHYLTVQEMTQALQRREVSSVELTQAHLERIAAVEPQVGAYVTVTEAEAKEQARQADVRIAAGDAGPLTGIPMQLKDNMSTNGVRTTCSSRMLEQYVPRYDATVTARLKDAGAVLLGKGNMDEFAMGSSTENSALQITSNPWDTSRVPGGSSGGPAAAVAAGEAAFSLGSDTGGSIRQPAALCGIVGLKPTYGLVSRYGLIAFASSLDQIGPITRTVQDAAVVMNSVAGHDPMDSTSINQPIPDYTADLDRGIKGLRVGLPRAYFEAGIDPAVEASVREAIAALEAQGAIVEEVSLPHTQDALAVYYIIAPSECSANLARYDGVKFGYSDQNSPGLWEALDATRQFGFGPEVKRRILLGTYALSAGYYDAFYKKAQQVRTLIRQELEEVFTRVDVLATPTSPTVAFKQGERTADPVQMYLSDICTLPINISGIPAISVPCGFADGLPVGLQLMGPHLSEATLFRTGHAYQQATDWHTKHPA